MLDLHQLSDENLLKILSKMRDVTELLYKARSGEKLTFKEYSTLRKLIVDVAKDLGFKLPILFNGWLTVWFLTRIGPLRRMSGVSTVTDNLIYIANLLLNVLFNEIDYRFMIKWLRAPKEELENKLSALGGYANEIVIRGFLREVIGGKWMNCIHYFLDSVEIDIYAESSDKRLIHIGEVKTTLKRKQLKILENNLSKLAEIFRRGKRKIATVALAWFKSTLDKKYIIKQVKDSAVSILNYEPEIELYDLKEICNYCKNAGQTGKEYINAIKFLIDKKEFCK